MSDTARICIVDDNLIARETLADLLYPENYELLLLESGLNLLSRIDQLAPDVILLDVMMPNMNGFDVCQRLKTNPTWQHIPIILVTALDSKDSLVRGLDAGADEFLSKPVNGSELRARVRSMLRIKQQYDDLHATLQLREEMANMLIHDMRTPLSTISLYLGLVLQRDNLADDDQRSLQTIQSELRHLESFINDMLLVVKMGQGKLLLHKTTQNITELVENAAEQHGLLAELRQIRLETELPDQAILCNLDENLFSRVLDNLLSNALKFAPQGSVVTLRINTLDKAQRGYSAQIQLIDQGPGIPEEKRPFLFTKFDIATLKQTGMPHTGLGLTLCKMVVDAHKGQIYVSSNKPTGAIFTVEI